MRAVPVAVAIMLIYLGYVLKANWPEEMIPDSVMGSVTHQNGVAYRIDDATDERHTSALMAFAMHLKTSPLFGISRTNTCKTPPPEPPSRQFIKPPYCSPLVKKRPIPWLSNTAFSKPGIGPLASPAHLSISFRSAFQRDLPWPKSKSLPGTSIPFASASTWWATCYKNINPMFCACRKLR